MRACIGSARGAWLVACLCLASICAVAAASSGPAQTISGAVYAEPTSEYPHGVLGDALEWKTVHVTVTMPSADAAPVTHTIRASASLVFEDIAPRLWDVTGDGAPEVVVVQSHKNKGARLLILGLDANGQVAEIAATPHIGTRFRWLAPVGAADFDQDGHIEIAFVDRPHLAKTVHVWRFTPNSFAPVASLRGVTNHRIGEDFISGGIRNCQSGPEMILADANWRNIVSVRLNKTKITSTRIAPFTGPAGFNDALRCP